MLLEVNQSLNQSNKTIELSEKISQIYQDIRTISHDLSTHFIKDKNLNKGSYGCVLLCYQFAKKYTKLSKGFKSKG